MRATKANLNRCGFSLIMCCPTCYSQNSADDGDYWAYPDDHIFKCGFCGSEMILGYFATAFIPASPRVVCVIHDRDDYISTWLVETEPDADPLEAIHKELFEGDEDWDVYIKDQIEWFYLNPIAAMTLKDIEWPETLRDDQTFEHEMVKATLYRAFKLREAGEEGPKES